ncbi:MAG TPA: hypothetical protein VML50_13180 [Anaeromyxobacter sp.]|nr:hypothetical protein [Anaeromyxobacter sp.]
MQEVAAAAPEAVDALFGDLMVDPPAAPAPAFDFRSPGVYVPPPSTPAVAAACWPATAPSDGEAEAALLAAIAGTLAESAPLGAVAGQVVDGLSELELAVLQGAEQPVDTAPVRRAAVTRLRVAAALAALPAPGSPVDGQAVQALLAAIDGLLAEVNVLFGGAPPELQPGLEAVRNALVKEAIDFSEAAQRVGTPAAPVAAPVRREAQARVVSIDAIPEAEPDRRGRRLAVVTAIAVALALGFHGYGWWQRTHVSRTPVVPGLPPGLVGSPPAPGQAAAYTISSDADRVEIEKFKQQQISLGKQVKEVGGALVILPAPPGAPSSAPEPK